MFMNDEPDISTDLEPSVFQSAPSFTSPAFMSLENVDPEEESNWVWRQLVDLMTHTQFIDECGESDDTDVVPAPHSLPNEDYGSSDLLVCLSGMPFTNAQLWQSDHWYAWYASRPEIFQFASK